MLDSDTCAQLVREYTAYAGGGALLVFGLIMGFWTFLYLSRVHRGKSLRGVEWAFFPFALVSIASTVALVASQAPPC